MKMTALPRLSGQLANPIAPIIRPLLRSTRGYIFWERVIEPQSSELLTKQRDEYAGGRKSITFRGASR